MLDKDQALDLADRLVRPNGYQPERAAQEELMLRSMAFFLGKQHFYQNGATLYELPVENEWEARYRANIILPAIEKAVAKVSNATGDFRVAPEDGTPKKRHAARTSDKVLEHLWHTTNYEDEKLLALKWAAICGSGYLRVSWDANIGDKSRYYFGAEGEDILPESEEEALALEQAGQFRDYALGDVRADALSPFGIHHDWDATKGPRDARWMAESHMLGVDTVAEFYDLKVSDLETVDDVPGAAVYDQALAFMTSGNSPVGFGYKPDQVHRGRTLVTAIYYKACPQYPKGLYILRIGRKVHIARDNPYRDIGTGLPYVKQNWITMPGRWWGVSLVEQLMGAQFQYNAARGKMTEFQNVWGQPPIFFPEDSGIDVENFALVPGAAYQYRGMGKIQALDAPQFPPEVAQNSAIARQEVDMISSQSDPDLSNAPGQMRSGLALRTWFTEKNRQLSTVQKASMKVDRQVGEMYLALGKRHYTDDRKVLIFGDTGDFEALHFRGADLHHDVRVIGVPHSEDEQLSAKAEIMDLIQIGALDPVNNKTDRRMIMTAFRYKTADEVFADHARDQTNQEREIHEMMADPSKWSEQPYPVADYEDHEVHAETLARFMKTDDFRALDQFTKSVLYVHFQLHVQKIQEAIQAQLEQVEAAKGAPGQKGKASQPSTN